MNLHLLYLAIGMIVLRTERVFSVETFVRFFNHCTVITIFVNDKPDLYSAIKAGVCVAMEAVCHLCA